MGMEKFGRTGSSYELSQKFLSRNEAGLVLLKEADNGCISLAVMPKEF